MKKFLCILLSSQHLCYQAVALKMKKFALASAGIGGMYYTFGNAFTELASKENDKFNFEVKSTAGSAANIRLLSKNYIEMGIAQADLINDAITEPEYLSVPSVLVTRQSQHYTLKPARLLFTMIQA